MCKQYIGGIAFLSVLMFSKTSLAQGMFNYLPVPGNNFVRTYAPQQPTDNPAAISLPNQTAVKCRVNTQYYDGIGRPLQEVARAATGTGGPTQHDIVTAHIYDNTGKEQNKFVPFSYNEPVFANRGKLKRNVATIAAPQYATIYPGDQAFAKTVYDNSPLNRVEKTMPPGHSWVGTGNGVIYTYYANGPSDNVRYWKVGALKTDPPVLAGTYADGKLYVTRTVDENAREVIEYKDIAGKVVLKKQKKGTTYLETAYVYDDFGRVRWVIPPQAFTAGITTASGTTFTNILKELCYNYFYDKRGRLVERTIPGKAVEYFVYDKYDRMVLYQNGNIRRCGLPIYTGPIDPYGMPYGGPVPPAYIPEGWVPEIPSGDSISTPVIDTSRGGGTDSLSSSPGGGGSGGDGLGDSLTVPLDTLRSPGSGDTTGAPLDTLSFPPMDTLSSPVDSTFLPGVADSSGFDPYDSTYTVAGDSIMTTPLLDSGYYYADDSTTLSIDDIMAVYDTSLLYIEDTALMQPLGFRRLPPSTDPIQSSSPEPIGPTVFPSETADRCSWYFTYYDVLDRNIMTGLYVPYYNLSREGMQDAIDNGYAAFSSNYLMYFLYYDQFNAYPASLVDAHIWTINYYDDHTNPVMFSPSFDASYNTKFTGTAPYAESPVISSKLTRGLLTGSKVCILDPAHALSVDYTMPWMLKVNFYDDKARVIQVKAEHHRVSYEVLTNQYNFGGDLVSSVLHRNDVMCTGIAAAPASTFAVTDIVKNYTVDIYNGKPRSLTQKINTQAPEVIYNYSYDDIGRAYNKNQNVVNNYYKYNVRGWLTGINDGFFNTSATGIFFKEKLMYENLGGYSMPETNTPLGAANTYLNGNIAQILWQHAGASAKVRSYRYTYDDLNRVTMAKFSQREDPLSSGSWAWTDANTDYTMSNVSYDDNGNIKTMNHKGDPDAPGPPIDMDLMTYAYQATSNKLAGVADAAISSANPDLEDDVAHSFADYSYDPNGNLTKDGNKGITLITYSHLDKPQHIDIPGKGTIDYVYDAAGNRLQKLVKDMSTGTAVVTRTDYVGPFVYKNNVLQFINHEEGRTRPVVGTATTPTYVNDYFVKDHLTNVRAVVTANAYYGIPDADDVSTTGFPLGGTTGGGGTGGGTTGTADPGMTVAEYLATHEIAAALTEGALFNNIDMVRALNPYSTDSGNVMVATLDGTDSAKRIGTAIMLKVMPGDQFSVSTQSYYEEGTDSVVAGSPDIVGSLLGILTGGSTYDGTPLVDVPRNAQIVKGALTDPAFSSAYGSLMSDVYDPSRPAGFLNYVVLDERLNIVRGQSGALQVGPDAGEWQEIGTSSHIALEQPGYVLVFLSSASARLLSFDRLKLVYYRGSVLEEDHYYPFGLNISVTNPTPAYENKIKFVSKELQRDEFVNAAGNKSGLELYDFGARMQDPQIGRWNGIDQMASNYYNISPYVYSANDPVSQLDVDGRYVSTMIGGNPYIWNNGAFYYGATKYTGDDVYVARLTSTLNEMASAPDAKVHSRYQALTSNPNFEARIINSNDNSNNGNKEDELIRVNGRVTGTKILWSGGGFRDQTSGDWADESSNLAHEMLGHGWQSMRGIYSSLDDKSWHPTMISPIGDASSWTSLLGADYVAPKGYGKEQMTHAYGLSNREHDAVSIESRFREATNRKPRKWYVYKGYYNNLLIGDNSASFFFKYPVSRSIFFDDEATNTRQKLKIDSN